MSFLLTVAWRNLWRHKRRSLITSVAMAVGVALCMATMAFNDGMFGAMFEVMVEQQLGHAQVHHPEWPSLRQQGDTLRDADALLARIDGSAGVVAASPRMEGFALLGTETKSSGALLVGIEPTREQAVTPIAERVVAGRFLGADPAAEAVLGVKLAEEIGVKPGDEVVAVTQSADGSLGNALYTVVGLVRTGNGQVDRGGAYLHLRDLQDLLVLPDQVHSVTVLTEDASDVEPAVATLRQNVGSDAVEVLTWWEASPQAAQMMGMRNISVGMVLAIVFGAAGFGVLNTMMMSVFERTRELGVLKALGLRPGRMVALILVESLMLAGLASAIGLVLGGLLDLYLVRVGLDLSASAKDGLSFAGVILDPVVKARVEPGGVAVIVAALVIVCVASSAWPAVRAARLDPVESLRAE